MSATPITPEERDLMIRDTAEYIRRYEENEAWESTPTEAAASLVDGFIRHFTTRTTGGKS